MRIKQQPWKWLPSHASLVTRLLRAAGSADASQQLRYSRGLKKAAGAMKEHLVATTAMLLLVCVPLKRRQRGSQPPSDAAALVLRRLCAWAVRGRALQPAVAIQTATVPQDVAEAEAWAAQRAADAAGAAGEPCPGPTTAPLSRDRETHRHTGRQTHRQTDWEADRQSDRRVGMQTRQTNTCAQEPTSKQAREASKPTG